MKNGISITSPKIWGNGIEFITSEPFIDLSDPYYLFLEEAIGHEAAYTINTNSQVNHRLRRKCVCVCVCVLVCIGFVSPKHFVTSFRFVSFL